MKSQKWGTKINKEITIILDKQDIKLKHIISSLQVLNPLNTLNRGYAIIRKDNKVISSVKKIKKDIFSKLVQKNSCQAIKL